MMIFLHKFLNMLVTLTLLSSPASTLEQVSQHSLWGKVADFTSGCSHWSLKVSIPMLRELTVCLNLRIQVLDDSPWTAFIYRHPEVQRVELGLGGTWDRLVVWMFGKEWITSQVNLGVTRWHSLCLTWSHTKDRPTLYVNGNLVDLVAAHHSASISPSCLTLVPNGTLTLGAAHILVDGKIQVVPFTSLLGKLSLFRLWGRKRSQQEVIALNCTEGDLVKWETDNWDPQSCPPLSDSTLQCEWSTYKVRLMFAIFRNDGNTTELYTARDLAHRWLREVLPTGIYLPSVSVSKVTSRMQHQGRPAVSDVSYKSSAEDAFEKTSHDFLLVRWANPNVDRFDCLVHVNVIPCLDVAAVQREMHMDLKDPYYDQTGRLMLLADRESIHTTPVESFSAATVGPDVTTIPLPVTTTPYTPASSPAATSETSTNQPISAATDTSFTQQPANMSELYFEVKVNVSITGDGEAEQVFATWLNSSLPDDMMTVLDLQFLPNTHRDRHHPNLPSSHLTTAETNPEGPFVAPARNYAEFISPKNVSTFKASRESCIFQVQVMMSLADTQEMIEQIRHLLLMPYSNGSVSIATEDVQISRILKLMCDAVTHQTKKGLFKWPTTSGGKNATWPCPKNPHRNATRHCKLCLSTKWMDPDLQACPLVVETIPDLDHVDVTAENALDVVEMIEDLLRNHSMLSYKELVTVLNKLEDVVNVSVVTPNLGQALINIISDILESDSYLLPFTNTILNLTEAVGDSMVGYEGSSTLVAPALAISVVDVTPGQFDSLTFGVSSDRTGLKPEIFINRYPFNSTVAFISLPSVLQHSFPLDSPRIQFQFYGIPVLFKSSRKGLILNSFVVSASVTNATSPIRDLDEDVKVTLHHLIPNTLNKYIKCVYWNFNKNNGHGGWDGYGCRVYNSSPEYTTCLCDHLTHFGLLLDVSRTQVDQANEQILTIITYIGCGISSLFLGITVLIYTAFEKLRRDYPSQILINLSLALLGLNLLFLVNSWLSSWGLYGLCVAVASTLHYFLLASLTWMGLEAVNMYFALVKVFNVYVPSYMLKFCALGWGMPLVICALVLIVNREAYGSLYTDAQASVEPLVDFCWLQDDVTFYVTVVAYALLVFLFNIAVFTVVLIQIRHMHINSPAGTRRGLMQELKGIASLTLLLGLTWTVGFFSWGPGRVVMLYLFTGLNTLQGVFIFLFHCLMKENVRKQLRIHLCLGRFRLDEYSDWSNSASLRPPAKPRAVPPRPSVPSVHSVKSSSTDSTSASSGSSQRDSACRRPNLGLFVNSLALPRAQKALQVGERCLPAGR